MSDEKETPIEVWEEYERRKRELESLGLSCAEHYRRVQEIAEELGL